MTEKLVNYKTNAVQNTISVVSKNLYDEGSKWK